MAPSTEEAGMTELLKHFVHAEWVAGPGAITPLLDSGVIAVLGALPLQA